MNTDLKTKNKIAIRWGNYNPQKPIDFHSLEAPRKYMLRCLSGEDVEKVESDWIEKWRIDTYLKEKIPVQECLSICCGFGGKERNLSRLGIFSHCTAIDISESAMHAARKLTCQEGITNIDYNVGDIETISLDKEKYDLVYASGALHHISNLEHVISEIYKSLKPGGLLISDEYVGPAYNKISFRHREIINSVIHLIPKSHRYAKEKHLVPEFFRRQSWTRTIYEIYRLITLRPFAINFEAHKISLNTPFYKRWIFRVCKRISSILEKKGGRAFRYGKVWDVYPETLKAKDPSEGARADEIIPIIKEVFGECSEVRYFNGSILQYALDQKFYDNFNLQSQHDRALLDLIINIESTMVDIGEVPPIYAHIYAQKS
jgi:ubiquinone/menaquinone biosynthesis C-methylase UbiE